MSLSRAVGSHRSPWQVFALIGGLDIYEDVGERRHSPREKAPQGARWRRQDQSHIRARGFVARCP
jgi:hypothetical protein